MTADDKDSSNSSDHGVDLVLIRWMLWLSPAERLQFMEERVSAGLRPQTDAEKLAILRATLEEMKKGPAWPQTPQQ